MQSYHVARARYALNSVASGLASIVAIALFISTLIVVCAIVGGV